MARMYSGKKGKSRSHKPPIRIVPRWFEMKKEEVEKACYRFGKKRIFFSNDRNDTKRSIWCARC